MINARAASTLLVMALVASSASAALTPGQKMAAEVLIKQFTAPEFETRQKAVDRLVEMGVDVAPVVKDALAKTLDAEVKLRCEMVLKALRAKFGAEAVDGKEATPAGAVNYAASRITLDAKESPLSEVLDELAKQSGNSAIDAKDLKDRPVTVAVKDVPYWQALDRILESTGAVYFPGQMFGRPSQFVKATATGPTLGAYCGPAAVWVDRVTRSKTDQQIVRFRTDFAPQVTPQGQRSLYVSMHAAVEDRLLSTGCGVRFTRALTADGKDVLPPQPDAKAAGLRRFRGMESSPMLYINNPPDDLRGPLTIEGVARVECFIGTIERKVDGILAGGRQTVGDDTVRLIDATAERRGDMVKVSFTLKTDDDHAGFFSYSLPKGYGLKLLDPEGTPRGTSGGFSGNGDNYAIDFRNVPDLPGKWSVVLVLPERADAKEYPFVIKDIPLP